MTHHSPDPHHVKAAAQHIEAGTSLLPHEHEALRETNLFREGDTGQLFLLLGLIDVLNARLHKQLVEWHTAFPAKPGLEESDQFWRELKELRSAKEQLALLAQAIVEQEQRINSLGNQLKRTQSSIDDVERYFDGYLDRINRPV